MATIVTRQTGASSVNRPLTNTEVDNNFINLNDGKVETSVSISTTAPVAGGGDLTTNRTIALAAGYGDTQNPYGSKSANFFLAAPNGSAGAPTFRAIVAADIPEIEASKIKMWARTFAFMGA
jgi:hypothetical protein